ncbi:MAG: AraC family transcriptional regulator [Fusicatenibacter sp.]|nr:AraC family transcriptional regulator [Lachnospiraceae bacterium]MDY2938174.1 AraC family transcriptional regulator [Fusicatenibacter sp.]
MEEKYTLDLEQVENKTEGNLVILPYRQGDMGSHDHRFFELVYITGGTAVQTLNEERMVLSPGDYFIMDYGSVHSYSQSNELTLINCLFLPEVIDDTLKGCRTVEQLMQVCLIRYDTRVVGETPANRVFHDEDGRVLWLLKGLEKEYQEKQTGYREIYRSRLREILILTLRSVRKGITERAKNEAVIQVIRYANEQFDRGACLSEFCRREHYSVPYISRKFHEETGMTFREYLQRLRIEKSCELLQGTSLSVEEIAERVGYEDAKFYRQIFRRMVKMTPKEYRKYGSI